MKKVTIYDVAEASGVAPSTVSRAFSSPGRVNAATRERVVAAAQELGYRPKHEFGAARSSRSRTIAMVLADITNPHFFEFIRGAEQRAKAAQHTLVLVNAEESPQIELAQIRELSAKVDGFVLASSRLPDHELQYLSRDRKLVLLNRDVEGLASVKLDMESGCRQILEHLASLGHTEFTYCAGPPASWMGTTRWAELSAGAAAHGLTAHRIGPYAPTVASGGAAADAALRTNPTALVAHNDLLAIGILRRLAVRGVRVPEDMSLVGFDNNFAADLVGVPLTTLGGPGAEVGRRAVEMLLHSIDEQPERMGALTDPPNDRILLPTELFIRSSSGPVRAG
ncbi:LacI family DNA-binding transcriptional regulator [Zhihengliuella alba]|uniref:LacI family DNA-binding transcriptional regulator n=1 Tax=Zhihengliuella alba TaxID=547018 RepID=A0ABP7DYA0_9MICC